MRETDRQADRPNDRQTDKQTEKWLHTRKQTQWHNVADATVSRPSCQIVRTFVDGRMAWTEQCEHGTELWPTAQEN